LYHVSIACDLSGALISGSLNHAAKLYIHSGDLPRSKADMRHKAASFLRTLQKNPDRVSSFFSHPSASYIKIQK